MVEFTVGSWGQLNSSKEKLIIDNKNVKGEKNVDLTMCKSVLFFIKHDVFVEREYKSDSTTVEDFYESFLSLIHPQTIPFTHRCAQHQRYNSSETGRE